MSEESSPGAGILGLFIGFSMGGSRRTVVYGVLIGVSLGILAELLGALADRL